MIVTDQMSDMIKNEKLCFVATVSPDNTPNISPKGSLICVDHSRLAFAEIKSPDTARNLESNPAVEINVVSPVTRKGYIFTGYGRVVRDDTEFHKIVSRFREAGIASTIRAAVIIELSHAEEITSPLYDLGYTQDQVTDRWKSRYQIDQ